MLEVLLLLILIFLLTTIVAEVEQLELRCIHIILASSAANDGTRFPTDDVQESMLAKTPKHLFIPILVASSIADCKG